MNNSISQPDTKALFHISILQALLKGFSVFYLLLLPILFAIHIITAKQLGYVGALLIVGVLTGAFLVTYKLHTRPKSHLLKISLLLLLGGTILLFWEQNIFLLTTAYIFIGLATGIGMSTINALIAQFTTKGKRYKILGNMAMLMDVSRIIYPLIAGFIYAATNFRGLVIFILLAVISFSIFIFLFLHSHGVEHEPDAATSNDTVGTQPITKNKPFIFIMVLEFLDSFASAQLFVFLPTLLIFRNFTIENALVMQSVVFGGYLSGRWLVSWLAQRLNGLMAVGIAEMGMVVTIILLTVTYTSIILYLLCFLLGIFSRGTSPVIKAMGFDRLEPSQIRRGSAIHVLSGDSGGAMGQLVFGMLLAWLGATAPFIASAICATVIVLLCLTAPKAVSTV